MRIFRLAVSVVLLASITVSGCERGSPPPASSAESTPVTEPPAAAGVVLQDVVETRPDYIIGISYPQSAQAYPGLARALHAYAAEARADLMKAVAGLNGQKPTVPYDLSLQFTGLVDTRDVVAVAADGSTYTGGAHGNPLVARFVWLPQRQQMLTTEQLITSGGWQVLSDASREQLMTTLSHRLDTDELEGAVRAEQLESGSRMIAAGTEPKADNFAQFEPVMDVGGRIRALRFVFSPYQVGPYADGTRTVEIPARVLLPVIQPDYRSLFIGG